MGAGSATVFVCAMSILSPLGAPDCLTYETVIFIFLLVSVLYADRARRSTTTPTIYGRIQVRVVIHLHLAIEFEASLCGKHVVHQPFQAAAEVVPLLFQQHQTLRVPAAVLLGGGEAVGLLAGVVDLQGENGEPVDHQARSLRV